MRRFVAEFSPLAAHPLVYAELPRAQHAFEIFHSPRTSHFLNAASTWLEWVLGAVWSGETRLRKPTHRKTLTKRTMSLIMIDAWMQYPTARH
ncbi:MAG: hypothetical protein CM15mP74_12490 [Halieaceae bacterium]|nr:MAG: hypothetical protein CM15mP74_12490 [Halieaceae bacterium]